MAISREVERCPHCGMPYMSSLAPGEDPANRYCYTCDINAGGAAMAERLAENQPEAEDELALQTLGTETPDGRRPGRMAPGFRRPVNKPNAGTSRPAMPATGSRAAMPATASRAAMPATGS